jgi:hypothetical protein
VVTVLVIACPHALGLAVPLVVAISTVPVTSTRSEPSPLMVPAMTSSPSPFFTGRDSPVIMDSFRSLEPRWTTPSTGTLAPGRTSTTSPLPSSDTGTSSSPPSVTRVAVSGSSLASAWSAPWASWIDRISIQWPSSMMVTSVASSHQSASASMRPSSTTQEKTNATVMASEMSVIMPGSLARSSPIAPWMKTHPP